MEPNEMCFLFFNSQAIQKMQPVPLEVDIMACQPSSLIPHPSSMLDDVIEVAYSINLK